jgi:D-alanyl-D-alanine carboxypeptidase/D-alanyl-D-alanine-endopeptidase (penicillin-binding protein 4)
MRTEFNPLAGLMGESTVMPPVSPAVTEIEHLRCCLRTAGVFYAKLNAEGTFFVYSSKSFTFVTQTVHLSFMKKTLLMAALFPLLVWGQEQATPSLQARLDTLIKKELPPESRVGIAVYDLTTREFLYQYEADKLCRPASTMKLLTAITALAQPEAAEPFRTEVYYRGTLAGDTLRGDVYVRGGFDPEFDEVALDTLVATLAALPVSVIVGKVYGDVSMKDSLYWGSGWLWDDNPAGFQPYLSPLMLNKGVVNVSVTPSSVRGDTAQVECSPASTYYTLTNATQSRTPDAGRLRLTRNWLDGGNHLVLSGNVSSKWAGSINLHSSQDFFMHTFVERLWQRGVHITGGYAFGELPQDTLNHLLVTYETPLQLVLDEMMKESDNLNAEALFCRLGMQAAGKRHVKAADALKAMRDLMREMGEDPARYRLADGCGLSHYDYLSPHLLVAFLRYAYGNSAIFNRLYKALPVSGIDGTLKGRMKNTPAFRRVHAKTGTFTGITALAGYLHTAGGHELAFAIMNQNQLSATAARKFQDAVCAELVHPDGEASPIK